MPLLKKQEPWSELHYMKPSSSCNPFNARAKLHKQFETCRARLRRRRRCEPQALTCPCDVKSHVDSRQHFGRIPRGPLLQKRKYCADHVLAHVCCSTELEKRSLSRYLFFLGTVPVSTLCFYPRGSN